MNSAVNNFCQGLLFFVVFLFHGCQNRELKENSNQTTEYKSESTTGIGSPVEEIWQDTILLDSEYLLSEDFDISELDMAEFEEKYVKVTF